MRKKELRSVFRSRRKSLTKSNRDQLSLDIANRCLRLPIWDFHFFHIFLSISANLEVDTSFLLTILQGKDKEIVVPKVSGPGLLSHYLLTDGTRLAENRWGVPEPVSGIPVAPNQLDVIFLPLLAFDTSGYRVGYGGGYYDRFLSECRKDAVKVGLSFFEPVAQISDLHENDVRMDCCVTPAMVYSF